VATDIQNVENVGPPTQNVYDSPGQGVPAMMVERKTEEGFLASSLVWAQCVALRQLPSPSGRREAAAWMPKW
jgi:hypothetical protein